MVTILWDGKLQTDRTIANNQPDITVRNNEKEVFMSIDTAVSGERNVIKKEAEKMLRQEYSTCGM